MAALTVLRLKGQATRKAFRLALIGFPFAVLILYWAVWFKR